MLGRAVNLLKFRLERFMLRGTPFRLLVVAGAIGLLSLAGGVAVEAVTMDFESTADAVWWAFLRLTDPGYLGDDEGTWKRVISTILTVAGYVVFLGALVAIMTQWLNQTMRRLESGHTPIAQNDHILLVGWTSRTVTVLREMLSSEGRVRRFLSLHGTRTLHTVLLVEEAGLELAYELRDRLGGLYDRHKISMRSGSSLQVQHLRRVDFAHAAAIVLPADTQGGRDAQDADTRTIKTLLSMSTHGRSLTDGELPLLVAEVFDARKLHVARRAYEGPVEIVASDRMIARLMAQNIRLPGISYVFEDLFTQGEGNAPYVRDVPDLVGKPFSVAHTAFDHAIPLGIARPQGRSYRAMLAPPADFVIQEDDRLVVLAHSYEDAAPKAPEEEEAHPPDRKGRSSARPARTRRTLLVGWSHKAPALLQELDRYRHERVEVTVFSDIPVADREEELEDHELTFERLQISHVIGDQTLPADLRAQAPGDYDNVVLLASDTMGTREESDAQTIVTWLLLRELLDRLEGKGPRVLVELLDRSNDDLFQDQPVEVIVSTLIVGRILAQVTLRRELRAVYDRLFGSRGPEFQLREPEDYGLDPGSATFRQLADRVAAFGDILVGVRDASGTRMNPEPSSDWEVGPRERLLVLTNPAET